MFQCQCDYLYPWCLFCCIPGTFPVLAPKLGDDDGLELAKGGGGELELDGDVLEEVNDEEEGGGPEPHTNINRQDNDTHTRTRSTQNIHHNTTQQRTYNIHADTPFSRSDDDRTELSSSSSWFCSVACGCVRVSVVRVVVCESDALLLLLLVCVSVVCFVLCVLTRHSMRGWR